MSLNTRIIDGDGRNAKITGRNQLVVSPLDYSTFYNSENASDNVAVNVLLPKTRMRFVITDIILAGDRAIAANGAVSQVYENFVGPTDSTVTTLIYKDEIAKQTRAVLTGLNIIVTEGAWVNLIADDTVVRANIGGYWIDA